MRTEAPGSSDPDVLVRAVAEARTLITFDKDFGELAFKAGLPAACGIVLFRISRRSRARTVERAVALLESRSDWVGHFSVIEDARIRMVPLPPSPQPPK